MKHSNTRKTLSIAASLVVVGSLMSCSEDKAADPGSVDVGLLVPLSGALQEIGSEAGEAFQYYVDLNGGKLGGRDVNITVRDEGDDETTSLPSAKRLIDNDHSDVIVGIASSANYVAVAPEATHSQIPLLGFGGQPDLDKATTDYTWLWQTSFTSTQPGRAIAPYILENAPSPVYAIGPDYEGGRTLVNSFVDPFLDLGGKLANKGNHATWTKWPDTMDWSEYFHDIAESGAKAIYAYYAGAPAIEFIKQFAKSEVKDLPLYGVLLTEGSVLEGEGASALGVQTVMNYSPDIDNAANRTLVSEWSNVHPDRQTSLYTMAGWDAALVLDRAIARIPADEEVTPAKINDAMGTLGTIDSSRGTWQFSSDTHIPIQRWYLRTVDTDGPIYSNVVIADLDTVR